MIMTFIDLFKLCKNRIQGAYSSAKRRGVCLILIFAALLSFSACGDDSAPMKKTYYEFFDTVCVVYYYGNEGEKYFEATAEFIEGELDRYHRLFAWAQSVVQFLPTENLLVLTCLQLPILFRRE